MMEWIFYFKLHLTQICSGGRKSTNQFKIVGILDPWSQTLFLRNRDIFCEDHIYDYFIIIALNLIENITKFHDKKLKFKKTKIALKYISWMEVLFWTLNQPHYPQTCPDAKASHSNQWKLNCLEMTKGALWIQIIALFTKYDFTELLPSSTSI